MSGPRKKPNSTPHVFLKNSSSGTDQRLLDADFDRYWDDESKNNNRNRIRVGRQYQATVPPLLKPGEADGRRCEDLETLKWKPDQEISDEQLDNYLSVVKAVSLFAKAIDIYQNPDSETGKCLQNALRGLSEFVTSHHPSQSESGCQVTPGSDSSSCASSGGSASSAPHHNSPGWSYSEGSLFLKALDVCGKNFAAIKKDFLPWKPVRNLIEYYYCGQKSEVCDKSGRPGNVDAAITNSAQTKSLAGQAKPGETDVKPSRDPTVTSCTVSSAPSSVSGEATVSKPEENDTVGSLKFYLGGQMVLKLNARQECVVGAENPRCQWVQSKDNSLKAPPAAVRRKRKKRQLNGQRHANHEAKSCSGTDSDACVSDTRTSCKRKVPCATVVSPKPAWTPPVETNIKCDDSPVQEDRTGLRGS